MIGVQSRGQSWRNRTEGEVGRSGVKDGSNEAYDNRQGEATVGDTRVVNWVQRGARRRGVKADKLNEREAYADRCSEVAEVCGVGRIHKEDERAAACGLRARAAENARYAALSAWLEPVGVCAVAALIARVQPIAGLAPFAIALLAAAVCRGCAPATFAALTVGLLTGAFGADGFRGRVLAGAATVLAGAGTVAAAGRWIWRHEGRASPRRCMGETTAGVLAALGVLVPGAGLAAGGAWESAQTLGTAAAAAASAPFLCALKDLKLTRRHLMPEERAGVVLVACALAAGLGAIWPPLATFAACMAILLAAPFGAGGGACAGLAMGAATLLVGGSPGRVAALGVTGLLTGLAPLKKRWTQSAALALAAPAACLSMNASALDSAGAVAAALAMLAVDESVLRRLRLWLSPEQRGACDPDRLAARLRADTERRLRALSAAFGDMAESYRQPVEIPDEQTLIADMRAALCEGCSGYESCWAGDDNRAVRFLCQMISEAIDWAGGDALEPLFGDEMPPDALRQCRRGRTIPARLGPMLEDFARRRRSEMKRSAMNQLISAQFMQAQMLLCGMADGQSQPIRVRGRQAARARAALDRARIAVRDVMALRGEGRMEIIAILKEGVWTQELAARASAQLGVTFGRGYAPCACVGQREMRFVRQPRLRAQTSAKSRSRIEGAPCGDSSRVRLLDGDRLLLMLSDGMGSGEAAARESAQTLRLLERFLAAGVDRALALETVNEMMLARSDADMFATVDLCSIDLTTGEAEFTKLAACRSLIVRGGEVLSVEGGRLPLGILEGVRPSVSRVRLQEGDVVVMASDGVLDALDAELLDGWLSEAAADAPERLAERLLNLVERDAHRRRDDMTVLGCRLVAQGA